MTQWTQQDSIFQQVGGSIFDIGFGGNKRKTTDWCCKFWHEYIVDRNLWWKQRIWWNRRETTDLLGKCCIEYIVNIDLTFKRFNALTYWSPTTQNVHIDKWTINQRKQITHKDRVFRLLHYKVDVQWSCGCDPKHFPFNKWMINQRQQITHKDRVFCLFYAISKRFNALKHIQPVNER